MRLKRYPAAALLACALAAAALLYFSQSKPTQALGLKTVETLTLHAEKTDAQDIAARFGSAWQMSPRLTFIEALTLRSEHPQFGGWSGLAFDARTQQLIAVSDTGHWLSFTPPAPGKDTETRMAARMGPLLAPNGQPVGSGTPRDIEAIALTDAGIWLSYESPRSGLYFSSKRDIGEARFQVQHQYTELFSGLAKGYGIESLTAMRTAAGTQTLLAIAERAQEESEAGEKTRPDTRAAWLIEPGKDAAGKSQVRQLTLHGLDGYDLSEVAWSAHCGLFGVQRKLTWYGRLKVRLVKLNITGDRMDSEVLFAGDSSGTSVDNYEGLAIVDRQPGACELYMLSDDNFLPVQKTILMQFRYTEAT